MALHSLRLLRGFPFNDSIRLGGHSSPPSRKYYFRTAAEAFDVLHRGRAGSLRVHSRLEEDSVLVWDGKTRGLLRYKRPLQLQPPPIDSFLSFRIQSLLRIDFFNSRRFLK